MNVRAWKAAFPGVMYCIYSVTNIVGALIWCIAYIYMYSDSNIYILHIL